MRSSPFWWTNDSHEIPDDEDISPPSIASFPSMQISAPLPAVFELIFAPLFIVSVAFVSMYTPPPSPAAPLPFASLPEISPPYIVNSQLPRSAAPAPNVPSVLFCDIEPELILISGDVYESVPAYIPPPDAVAVFPFIPPENEESVLPVSV